MADDLDQIRQRIHIVDLVSEKVALKRSGKNWTGLCPFHDDKNPSFTVSDATGRYKCWSCGASGDIFNWVMETQRLSFAEAIDVLAEKAGVERSKKGPGEKSKRQVYILANDTALAYYRDSLPKSKAAMDYCNRRGLDEATRETWEIGFAPDSDQGLTTQLQRAGILLADARELFLLRGDQSQGYSDMFRARLMFSIRDDQGKLVAFGGRLLGQGEPKYINSSQTPVFNKSRVLYGMHRAKEFAREKDQLVLVEGYLDVIACHKAGVRNAVASLGTAFTPEHAALIKRWCSHVVILYDSDNAGQKAASSASAILMEAGLHVRIALMPQGQDPDSLLREVGPEAVVRAVESGVSKLDFEIGQLKKRLEPTLDEFWDEAVQILSGARSRLELEGHVEALAPLYPRIKDPLAAREALRKMVLDVIRARRKGETVAPRPAAVQIRVKDLKGPELLVLRGLLSAEFRVTAWKALLDQDLMSSDPALLIAAAVSANFPDDPPFGDNSVWLPRLGEQAAGVLAEIEMLPSDRDGGPLSSEVIDHALGRMRSLREQNALKRMRLAGIDESQIQEYLRRMREEKGEA